MDFDGGYSKVPTSLGTNNMVAVTNPTNAQYNNTNPELLWRFERRDVFGLEKVRTLDPRTFGITALLRYRFLPSDPVTPWPEGLF